MNEDKSYINIVVNYDPEAEKIGFSEFVEKPDDNRNGVTIHAKNAVFINEAEVVFRYAGPYTDPDTGLVPFYKVKATGRQFQQYKYNVTIRPVAESEPLIGSLVVTGNFSDKIQALFKEKNIGNENIREYIWIVRKEAGSRGRIGRYGVWGIYHKGECPDPEPPSKKTLSLAQKVKDKADKAEAEMKFTGEETQKINELIECAPEIKTDPPTEKEYIDFFMNTTNGCGVSLVKAEWMYKNRNSVGLP